MVFDDDKASVEPRPLLCFMDKPTYVADEDDARAVLKRPEALVM